MSAAKTKVRLLRLAVIVLIVGGIEAYARSGLVASYTLAPPSLMAVEAWRIVASGRANADLLFTLKNVAAAMVLSLTVGFLVGVGLHRLPRLRRAVGPLLASYYAVPVFIFYPLLIVMFGLNAWPLIGIGFLFAVVAVIVNTLNAFDRVPRVYFRTAQVMRLNRVEAIRRLILPAALPHLFTGLKLAVAYSFIGVIAGEFILAASGVGYRIAFAYNNFQTQAMYGLMLLILALVMTINLVLHGWEARLHARRGGR